MTVTTRRTLLAGLAATPALAVPALAIIPEHDPIYPAIARARACEVALDAADADAGTPDELIAEMSAARTSLARTVPTTPGGLAAMTAFIREIDDQYLHGTAPYFDDPEDSAAFNVSLDTAVRGMAGLKPWEGVAKSVRPEEPDPIYAAIDAHRKAEADFSLVLHEKAAYEEAFLDKHGRFPKRSPHNIAERRAGNIDDRAMWALVRTVPTTAVGLIAALVYMRSLRESDCMHAQATDSERLLEFLWSIESALSRLGRSVGVREIAS